MGDVTIFHLLLFLLASSHIVLAKIHHLSVVSDTRLYIEVTDFAFLQNAFFNVEISNFTSDIASANMLGFTFSKGNAMEEILKTTPQFCPLLPPEDSNSDDGFDDIVYFRFNFPNKSVDIVRRGETVSKLDICAFIDLNQRFCQSDFDGSANVNRAKSQKEKIEVDKNSTVAETKNVTSGGAMKRATRMKRESVFPEEEEPETVPPTKSTPLLNSLPLVLENKEYYTKFSIRFWHLVEEGEYYLYFHNCYNYVKDYSSRLPVSFSISVVEKNANSYLPAGEIGKPNLYFGLAALFLATAVFWVYVLRSSRDNVYRIHYLMTALVFIKALSLFFHGVNFYFISVRGRQQEAWAVVYYIMHLLKGALLFGTIILIGTGWTFFKNFLTDRDRRLFMIIIPLQVIDNIALIIILESEEGERSYRFWWQLFILVDLLCCAAIILPVIWSIRHLQEASQTDGKAAFNLKKLKLFRHFYIIIIIYIYTTRILRYLISFVVPFQYEWLLVVVEEIGTWFFFVITGYKFRPVVNNPYLRLAQADDDDMDTALTQSGVMENVVRVNIPKASSGSGARRKGKREEDEEQETGLLEEQSLEHD